MFFHGVGAAARSHLDVVDPLPLTRVDHLDDSIPGQVSVHQPVKARRVAPGIGIHGCEAPNGCEPDGISSAAMLEVADVCLADVARPLRRLDQREAGIRAKRSKQLARERHRCQELVLVVRRVHLPERQVRRRLAG